MPRTISQLAAVLSRHPKPTVFSASIATIFRRGHSLPGSESSSTDTPESNSAQPTHTTTELTRLATVVDGCDYEHWLVLTQPPIGYPERNEIVQDHIRTLAMALGSEDEAKRSIYSVSTKYYYGFGCKIPQTLTHKIKSLPNVRWVLPDSYLCHGESDYGGEPLIQGELAPYDDKYHADWLRVRSGEKQENMITSTRKTRRRIRKRGRLSDESSGN